MIVVVKKLYEWCVVILLIFCKKIVMLLNMVVVCNFLVWSMFVVVILVWMYYRNFVIRLFIGYEIGVILFYSLVF